MTIYFISGQAADRRIFRNLVLPSHFTIRHIDWIEPLPKEPFKDYCHRLAQQMDDSNEFILLGLSFGGLAAIEINKIRPARLVILLSSVATRKELPLRLKIIAFYRLHKIVPTSLLKIPTPLTYWFFDTRSEEEKRLIEHYITSVSKNYLDWSIDTILNWSNKERPSNLYHIHGNADRIFPIKRTKPDVSINDGGHLMVFNKAEEISKVLNAKLSSY